MNAASTAGRVPPTAVEERVTAQRAALGECPNCGTAVPSGRLLIEYEAEDGGEARAERPDRSRVVDPRL